MTSDTLDTSPDDASAAAPRPARPRVVGIAASAGGLEAVSLLAQNLPQNAGAIYVIAQHMSPTHKSVLSTLIARETRLPVHELEAETKPELDAIYVTPPNTDVIYENGVLRLRQPSGHAASPKPSADRLFKSLAEECGEACMGIVLSGTGSDGSYGVQAVREAGGITIAQEPSTAKYDGMPISAIETGCIDLTLSPEQIGTHLEKILARPRNFDGLRTLQDHPNPLGELFGILLARTHVDFADYKENTLNRRIARRMTALDIDDYDDYVDFCRSNVSEVDALHRYLLISVTRFFRDPDQFEKLERELKRSMQKRSSGPIRVWVVGCATGEEAFSIAITIAEILGGIGELSKNNVQVFATDIDQNAIEVARRGIYPVAAAQDIPPSLLNQYFTVTDTEIKVRPELRAATLFSHHNVFQDPPFINVDLVSIRNLLIYFNLALQERVLSRLHYAMAAGALLFVGTSETVGEMGVFFEGRQGADKIFAKRRGVSGELANQTGARSYQRHTVAGSAASAKPSAAETNEAPEMPLARVVAPNGMICTRNGNIIEVLGDLSPFMEIRAGASSALNIKMLIDPLRGEIGSLIAVALRSKTRRDGRWHTVSLSVGNRAQLQVFPFSAHKGGEMQCLIAINTKFEKENDAPPGDISDKEQRAYIERMEMEIRATQEALQQTIEELQTANEEMQAANEELQSTNEEFQATNEELETSNEELQSSNEELMTVNEELQISSAERQALASELEATMTSAPYSVALADQALMVRRLSHEAMNLFGLSEVPPTGVHLSQCSLPDGFPALAPMANTVLRVQETRRTPILSRGKYFTMIMSPVHDLHRKLIGLSITITQYDSEPLSRVVQMMSDISHVAHWSYNLETKELFWSPEMFAIHGRPDSGQMPSWADALKLIHPEDRTQAEHKLDSLSENGGSIQYEHRVFGPAGHLVPVSGKTTLIRNADGEPVQMIGVMWNTADEIDRDVRLAGVEAMQEDLGIGFFWFDVENNAPRWNKTLFDLLGFDDITHTPSVESLLSVVRPDIREQVAKRFQAALEQGEAFSTSFHVMHKDGTAINCECVGRARIKGEGKVTHVFGSLRRIDQSAKPAQVAQAVH
ncbi:chemotaxis protein CheB [uncultured Tateyamaria sp.]|uniref:chemotaxis protein CheB n=1 Tax=uncultured Tateyamaria sp. TaxID=455651 RepID=UPI00261CA27C|nr:chemotaxis protein CheB [uncultured Tateyamaria sp.]